MSVVESLFKPVRSGLKKNALIAFVLFLVIYCHIVVFAVFDGIVWRPLPFPDAERLVNIWGHQSGASARDTWSRLSYLDYRDWRENNDVFEDIAAYQPTHIVWSMEDGARILIGASVSGNFFALMGVKPELGRFLTDDDIQRGATLAVVSHDVWARELNSRATVLGTDIELDGTRYQIVGVAPASFRFRGIPTADPNGIPQQMQVWIPLKPELDESRRYAGLYQTIARLKREASLQNAQAQMTTIARSVAKKTGTLMDSATVVPYRTGLIGDTGSAVQSLWLSSMFILLVGSVNAAHVLLARNLRRRNDFAVRRTLGASVLKVCALPASEYLIACVSAGGAALLVTYWTLGSVLAWLPENIPLKEEVVLHWSTALRALATSLSVACVAFLPLLAMLRRLVVAQDLFTSLRGNKVGRLSRGGGGFVVTEIALVLSLAVGASLMMQSFYRLSSVCRQLPYQDRFTFKVSLPYGSYSDPHRVRAFQSRLLRDLGSLADIAEVAAVSELPLTAWEYGSFQVEGRADLANTPPEAEFSTISPAYFGLLGIRLLEGRTFEVRDDSEGPPVAIINRRLKKMFWPDKSAIGAKIRPGRTWTRIVGVVEDSLQRDPRQEVVPQIYLPMAQKPKNEMVYVYRSATSDPLAVFPAIRKMVYDLDPGVPLSQVRGLGSVVEGSLAPGRLHSTLLVVFSLAALVIVLIGVYGTVSYSVENRTFELGIRQAIGANRREVLLLVLRWAAGMSVAGILLGIPISIAVAQLLESHLFGVAPVDVGTLLACSAGLLVLTIVASLQPALRACRIDPVHALRRT